MSRAYKVDSSGDVLDDYVPVHDEFEQAGIDIYATPLDALMGYENLGHSVAHAMEHPYGDVDKAACY